MEYMRNNKTLLFACLGFLGGLMGTLIIELIGLNRIAYFNTNPIWLMAIIMVILSVFFLFAFFWAEAVHNRKKKLTGKQIKQVLVYGTIAGVIAGAVSQFLYGHASHLVSYIILHYIIRPFTWAIFGALMGWRFVPIIPNLKKSKAIIGGAIGGFLGGIGFILTNEIIKSESGVPARFIGFGIVGALLGLTVVIVERLFREGSLEIIWAPNEVTKMNLGTQPILIGGGDDHIFINGLPQNSASIVLNDGKILYKDKTTGKETILRNESQLKIGKVEIIVHAN